MHICIYLFTHLIVSCKGNFKALCVFQYGDAGQIFIYYFDVRQIRRTFT